MGDWEGSSIEKSWGRETVLKPVADELSSLKRQINIMIAAIFGKMTRYFNLSVAMYINHYPFYQYFFIDAGPRSSCLGQDMRVKLKATYTLVEQLYSGAQRAISAALHKKSPPSLIKEVLERLSVLP